MTDRPTEEQIREALRWMEDQIAHPEPVLDTQIHPDDLPWARTLLHLARRGAQRMAADRGSTHWPGCWRVHGECAAHLLEEAIEVLRAADDTDSRALLARIDQTEVDDDQ